MLLQMKEIVRKRKPDAFIIAGDIFDTAFPGSGVQTLFSNAIVELHREHPDMVIVIISGNHDSASRHEIFRIPWRALNVYALGHVSVNNPTDHIITISGKGHIVAVPYANDKLMPDGFFGQLLKLVPADKLPVVMTAHTTVTGACFDGHRCITENEVDNVGNINARSIDDMGSGYDYLALGHIHKAQFIHGGGHHRIRYCGSPLSISFDEPAVHSVSLVSISARGAEPEVEAVELKRVRSLITLPANGKFLPWSEAIELLKAHIPDGEEYIRLNVLIDKPLPQDRLRLIKEATEGKTCSVCRINPMRPETNADGIRGHKRTLSEFQQENPLTIAREYAMYAGMPMSDALISLFNEACSQVIDNK